MKDIFIDNNIAKNFSNPMDLEYKKLISWLIKYDVNDVNNKGNYAHLVVNQKLLVEYNRSSYNCAHQTSIPSIINLLTRQGRLNKISNKDIEDIKKEYLTKGVVKSILSNVEDHCHICSIIVSNRKLALTYDINLTKDLKKILGSNVEVEQRPEKISYL